MVTNRPTIPLAVAKKILKTAGAYRVSFDAQKELSQILLDYGETIGAKAVKLAAHAGRRTIQAGDLKIANT